MLTKLKQKIQKLLETQAKTAQKLELTPNKISALGIISALLSAFAYTQWQTNHTYMLAAALLLLLSGYCDALDGALARTTQKTTLFGGYLDSLLDRYADAAIYTGIIISGLCETTWGLIALFGSLIVSYTRARAEAAEIKMETIGIAERPERILIITAATITAFLWQKEAKNIINTAIILLAALTNLTVLQRTLHTYKKLQKR